MLLYVAPALTRRLQTYCDIKDLEVFIDDIECCYSHTLYSSLISRIYVLMLWNIPFAYEVLHFTFVCISYAGTDLHISWRFQLQYPKITKFVLIARAHISNISLQQVMFALTTLTVQRGRIMQRIHSSTSRASAVLGLAMAGDTFYETRANNRL